MTQQMNDKKRREVEAFLRGDRDAKPVKLYRKFQIDPDKIDYEQRTVELAFSSEAPYKRWFGWEILGHSEGEVRMERLENRAALLWNHDWDDQRGVVESARIDPDGMGRAVVRFSRTEDGEKLWMDVTDGIKTHVSVGYMVHEMVLTEDGDDGRKYRVTDWEPFEVSIVSVPADTSVGVGRSLFDEDKTQVESAGDARENSDTPEDNPQPKRAKMKGEEKEEVKQPTPSEAGTVDLSRAREEAREAERKRVADILELGRKYRMTELSEEVVRNGGTVADFNRAALDKINERGQTGPSEKSSDYEVGLNSKEIRKFSFLRLIRHLANPSDARIAEQAAFELEACRAAAQKKGKDWQEANRASIPMEVFARTITAGATGSGYSDTGANVVADDLMPDAFIQMLRNRSVAMRSTRNILSGLVGDITIPKQTGGATGYWLAEDEEVTASELTLAQLKLSPHTVGARTEITRKTLMQSTPSIEALVRNDLTETIALAIDLAAFYGTGLNGQPTGIASTVGINAVNIADTNGLPTYAELIQMESEISADNADVESMIYVGNAKLRGHLKGTQKFSGTNGAPIWEQGNTVNGYRAEITNQIADGDTFFGNFNDLLIGMWGGFDLMADPYSESTRGRLRLVCFQDVDFALRRTESFCLGQYSSPSP